MGSSCQNTCGYIGHFTEISAYIVWTCTRTVDVCDTHREMFSESCYDKPNLDYN